MNEKEEYLKNNLDQDHIFNMKCDFFMAYLSSKIIAI